MTTTLTSQFHALTASLRAHEDIWRDAPFYSLSLPWVEKRPDLYKAALSLSDADYDAFDDSPDTLFAWLKGYLPDFEKLTSLTRFPLRDTSHSLNPRAAVDVPGRKWQQIEAFSGALNALPNEESRLVDWCSGKSFLGTGIAEQTHSKLHAVEFQSALCECGQTRASKFVSSATFECKDVLSECVDIKSGDYVVALHACGDLHRTLLRSWRNSHSKNLALAPCCYHQWLKGPYKPISNIGKSNDLVLEKHQVRLAVQEMVTSSQRVRKQVKTLNLYRIAFDLLQRDIRKEDSYMSTPSLPNSIIKQGPEAVIRAIAEKKQLALPDAVDFEYYLSKAQERFAVIQRLQLVTHGFRQALETWLVLDAALYLEEAGINVDIATFCDRQISPRNLLIQATR